MATATKRFMNWTNVTFTPDGDNAPTTTFTGVTTVTLDAGGSLIKFSGDGDRYNTTVVNDHNEPTATVECADVASVRANPIGTAGTFTATFNDARNGTGTGAITYTLANAVVSKGSVSGAHRQFGKGTFAVEAYSTDGITNPLSTSVSTGS